MIVEASKTRGWSFRSGCWGWPSRWPISSEARLRPGLDTNFTNLHEFSRICLMTKVTLKCPCKYCGHHIEFSPDQIGKTIQCPKCQMDVQLFRADWMLGRPGAAPAPVGPSE